MDLLKDIIGELWDIFIHPFHYLIDSNERINFIYLISSALLAFYVYIKTKTNIPFYRYLFHKKVWLSKSAFMDYKLFFFNGVLKLILIIPFLYGWRYLGVTTNDYLEETFQISTINLGQNEALVYYSLGILIVYDLVYYLVHLSFHKIPFLWEFHKIHHSATSLNPITEYRLHPVELFVNNASFAIVSGVLMGVTDYFYQGSINQLVYAEANIFTMLFLFWGANLRHSHVKLTYFNKLERFILSPFQHQIHHSDHPDHFDKNFGSKFAIWDNLFGTLVRSKQVKRVRFGLGTKEKDNYSTYLKAVFRPFVMIGKNIVSKKNRKAEAKNH